MEKKKKYEVSADPDFDDFGVWLANRGQAKQKTPENGNTYRDQSKRLIDAQKKKKANKK